MAMRSRLGVLALLVVGLGLVAGWAWLRMEASVEARSLAPGGTRIVVKPGQSVQGVLQQLAAAGAVGDPRWVKWWLRVHRKGLRVLAGTYELAPGATVRQVLGQIDEGRVVLEQLTVVEGWTFAQMRAALDASPALEHEWRALGEAQLMSALGAPGVAAEGRFYPDTYRFAAGTPDRRLYEMAYVRMRERLAQAWAAREEQLPVATPDEALTLASIVEKETARDDERAKVAGVFTNRLRQHMPLQTDPTVIYGMGLAYKGNLRRRDLEADGPYNTYTRGGLPPTPIALPGGASLEAALHPAQGKALYFVATGNGDGSHHFSATYAEHQQAVLRFLKATGARPDRQALQGVP